MCARVCVYLGDENGSCFLCSNSSLDSLGLFPCFFFISNL